ncbi:PREDICTED: uncharacterized protein LOC109234925 [Nicotiana attenuata]|uniref:uncharacterized protein LOC109234925 n=1 Tax=Nicotiana attenuata TaxID=49451 RepID=UPI0009058E8D|nr:PREDICTED: uncharacterized protein LOC109234925 [Nicotiana attenuata]
MGHFNLKQYMVHLIQSTGQYVGLSHEDLQRHIQNFSEITDTYNYPNVFKDYVRLTLFPFSLLRKLGNGCKRLAGTLLSDIEKNPQVNAVTLRFGREVEEVPKKRKDKPILEGELIPKATHEPKKVEASSEPVEAARPPPPFPPQRLLKKNDDRMFNKFLSMLSQVQLNIPLVDVLREIPKYAKYIKDIVAHKRTVTEFETVAVTEECTSRVQSTIPQKLKDPNSFTIPVQIGNIDVGHALCDLGARIYLMPLSMFKKLGLGAPRPTTVILHRADRSIAP